MNKKEYQKKVSAAIPPSPKFRNTIKAYIFGGGICALGQGFNSLYTYLGASKDDAGIYVALTLIVIASILTALGVFDKLARHAGAGMIVPITGFANSVVSPAMEFKTEGRILGTGANMFKISGPVIVYSISAASVYGLIYWAYIHFFR